MKNSCVLALAACSGLLAVTPPARADILLPGQSVSPPAQQGSVALPPNVVASIPFTPFSFDSVSGMYREFVSANRTGNPLGGLSFEYQFNVTAGSPGVVQRFAANDFTGLQTNVTFAPAGTFAPTEADRSPAAGDIINFTLDSGVGAGITSMWLIVDTNAPTFAPNTVTLSGPGGFVVEPALGPTVPEPGTLPLALVSLLLTGALFGYRRLRRPKPALA